MTRKNSISVWLHIFSILFFVSFIAKAEDANNNSTNTFSLKIAVVDFNYIVENATAVQKNKEMFNNIMINLEQAMLKEEAGLKALEKQLIQNQGKISEEEMKKEMYSFNRKVSSVQKMAQEQKSKLAKAYNESMQTVNNIIYELIERIAQERKINLVMTETSVLFNDKDISITQDVLDALNNKLKSLPIHYEAK